MYAGWIGGGHVMHDAALLLRWSSTIGAEVIVVLFGAWRWIAPVQRFIFPYLGGRWSGIVQFQGDLGPDQRDVMLEIKHTLFGLRLMLDSKESTSWTLVVHAERHQDFERYRLYYVYLNERKEGIASAGERYRGLAVMRVVWGIPLQLNGDYFTDTHRRGTLHLSFDAPHPWWKLWR